METLERAIKTAAQSAILSISADQINVITLNWFGILGYSAGGFLLSVLTSICSIRFGEVNSPNLLNK